MEQNTDEQRTGLTREAKTELLEGVMGKIIGRTPDEQTVLSEVFLRDLYEESPLDSSQGIGYLTGGLVDSERVLRLVLLPSKAYLSEKQEEAVAGATFLYGIYRAATVMSSSGEEVSVSKVLEWLKNLTAKHHQEKGALDPLAKYREQVINILNELSGTEVV